MKIKIGMLLAIVFVTGACTSRQEQAIKPPAAEQAAIRETTFKVEGMTCDHCEMSICKGVGALGGVTSVTANHQDSTTHVTFDPGKTNEEEIIAEIEKRGYHVVQNQ